MINKLRTWKLTLTNNAKKKKKISILILYNYIKSNISMFIF